MIRRHHSPWSQAARHVEGALHEQAPGDLGEARALGEVDQEDEDVDPDQDLRDERARALVGDAPHALRSPVTGPAPCLRAPGTGSRPGAKTMQSGQIAASALGARDAGLPVRVPVAVHLGLLCGHRGSVVGGCASTSPSRPGRRRSARSGSSSTFCAPPRRSRRRSPRATSASTAAARSSEARALRERARRGLARRRAERGPDRGLRRRRLAARVPRRAARADGHLLDDERDARDPRDGGAVPTRSCSGACSISTPSRARRESVGRTC